jgi:hypothetical protein
MDSSTSVTATFSLVAETLTLAKSGDGAGAVASSPAGIACGASCAHNYPYGTTVTLTAAPSSGSTFTGWSGGGCSGTGSCAVTMNGSASVTATFNLVPETLTLARNGDGAGIVTSSPAGIACGATCTHDYPNGTIVTLTAAPSSGSTFTGWSGAGCSGTGTCTVTMTNAATVTTTFGKDCTVPAVKGKSLTAARRAIRAHDCRVGKVTHAFSSKVKRGDVISQKPRPHKRLAHGAKVDLVVSKGKKP